MVRMKREREEEVAVRTKAFGAMLKRSNPSFIDLDSPSPQKQKKVESVESAEVAAAFEGGDVVAAALGVERRGCLQPRHAHWVHGLT